MKSKIIEATQTSEVNWGKFLVQEFDEEWGRRSALPGNDLDMPVLAQRGWAPYHILVTDLETGEGAMFSKRDPMPLYSLAEKHQIWVCPLFEPFLLWLCNQDFESVEELPEFVSLDTSFEALSGYRRGRRDSQSNELWRGIDRIVEAAVQHGVNDRVGAAIAFVDRTVRARHGRRS